MSQDFHLTQGDRGVGVMGQIFDKNLCCIVLVMGGQELFMESKNLDLLPRYDLSKMAPTRAIS